MRVSNAYARISHRTNIERETQTKIIRAFRACYGEN